MATMLGTTGPRQLAEALAVVVALAEVLAEVPAVETKMAVLADQ